jgi:hypothetical protein
MTHYNNRYYITVYKLFTTCLLLLVSASLSASELTAFKASYMIFRNDQHVADASFSLQQTNDIWIWSMQTSPRGIYKWLTRKRPYIETQMKAFDDAGQQLFIEVSGDYPEKAPLRASWFDQRNHIIYYSDKNRQSQLPYSLPTYNYHSINLLFEQMKKKGEKQLEIDFYKNGALKKSTVTLQTNLDMRDGDKNFKVDKLSQSFEDTKDSIHYYYQNNELAPLKIEQIKSDYVSVMWRNDIK